jgi:hypothetical protein
MPHISATVDQCPIIDVLSVLPQFGEMANDTFQLISLMVKILFFVSRQHLQISDGGEKILRLKPF